MINFKSTKDTLKLTYEYAKNNLLKFYNWKKEEVGAWILKILAIVLLIFFIICIIKVLPYLFVFSLLIIVFFADRFDGNMNRQTNPSNNFSVLEQCFSFSREVICRILYINSEFLNIYQPKNVTDIVPTKYHCLYYINGIPYFRFIILPQANHEKDFSTMLDFLNQKIMQYLQSNENTIGYPFYKDLPCLYILGICEDLYHPNHFRIDVMPITDEKSYEYIKQYQLNQSGKNESNSSSQFMDKDF